MKSGKVLRRRQLQRCATIWHASYLFLLGLSRASWRAVRGVAFDTMKMTTVKTVLRLMAFTMLLPLLNLYASPTFTISGGALTSVEMNGESEAVVPDGVTCIVDYAFRDCITLANLTISASVTSIGGVAFCGCSNLVRITLTGNRPFVSSGTFDDVSSMCVVRIPRNNTTYWNYVRNGRWEGMTVEYYDPINNPDPGEDTNPVTWTITDGELTGVELNGETDVTVPSSVTKIGSDAFSGCTILTRLTIPASVTSIAVGAFTDCSGLTSIVVDDENPVYKFQAGYLLSKDGKTLFMRVLGNAAIPSGVQAIGDQAFRNCTGLTNVTIPEGVTSIGNQAFYGCSGLARASIPVSVTSIGQSAFSNCSGSLYDSQTVRGVCLVDGWAVGHYSTLPTTLNLSGIRGIGDGAFCRSLELKILKISGSVKNIGKSAFSDCEKLQSVLIGDGVVSIGDDAFGGCPRLTSVTIPDSVTSIGIMSFGGDTSLANVTIPISVTNIGRWAFVGCSSLSLVFAPSRLSDDLTMCNLFVGCKSDLQLVFYEDADWITVRFDANGGAIEPSITNTPKKCVRGYAIGDLPVPTDQRFIGWFTDPEGGDLVTAETVVSGSTTLYAHWPPPAVLIYAFAESGSEDKLSIVTGDTTNTMSVFFVPQSDGGVFVTNITFVVKEGFEIDRVATNGVDVAGAYGKRGVWTLNLTLHDARNLTVFASAQVIGCDKFPQIEPSASFEVVAAALAGVTDDGLISNVTNAIQYSSYRRWALSLTNDSVSAKMVKTSTTAWLSYALGADAIIDKEIVSDDIQIESFRPSDADGRFEFLVGVDGVNIGGGEVDEGQLKTNLKKVFGLEGGTSPGYLSEMNVDITFHEPENGKVKFTAGPNADNAAAKRFFMKVKMSP